MNYKFSLCAIYEYNRKHDNNNNNILCVRNFGKIACDTAIFKLNNDLNFKHKIYESPSDQDEDNSNTHHMGIKGV